MKIYLIRHGETKEGAQGIILGSIGGNLNDTGLTYSREVARFFKANKIHLAKIICSNLSRAIQTSEIISKELHVPLLIEELVRERFAGVAEGKREQDIDWVIYESVPLAVRKHQGGESFQEVKSRAEKFIKSLTVAKQQNILIVSHSVFILMFLSIIKGISIEDALKIKTSDTLFVVDLAQKRVETISLAHSQ